MVPIDKITRTGLASPWSKVLFSPLFPDSLLCNMYAKRCLAPQQLSTMVKCSIFRVPVNWSEVIWSKVIWSKIFGIPTLYKVVQTLVYGTPYRMVYRTVYRMVWVYRTIQLWTNLYRVLYGTVCTVLFEVVKVKGRQSNDDITCYRICLWKYAEKQ